MEAKQDPPLTEALVLIASLDGDVIQIACTGLSCVSIASNRQYTLDVFSQRPDTDPFLSSRQRIKNADGTKGESAVEIAMACGQDLPSWASEAKDP